MLPATVRTPARTLAYLQSEATCQASCLGPSLVHFSLQDPPALELRSNSFTPAPRSQAAMADLSARDCAQHPEFERICCAILLGLDVERTAQVLGVPPFLVEACRRHYQKSPTYSPDGNQPESSKSAAAHQGEPKTFASVAAAAADTPPDGTSNAATAPKLPFKIPKRTVDPAPSRANTPDAELDYSISDDELPATAFKSPKKPVKQAAAARRASSSALRPKGARLSTEEPARRIAENLCFYCGRPDHKVEDCSRQLAKALRKAKAKGKRAVRECVPSPDSMDCEPPSRWRSEPSSDSD